MKNGFVGFKPVGSKLTRKGGQDYRGGRSDGAEGLVRHIGQPMKLENSMANGAWKGIHGECDGGALIKQEQTCT
jgi:hypothetical protein